MTYIQPASQVDDTALTWPALVSSTADVLPASWLLEDPKSRDRSILLAGAGNTRTFTPEFHSGVWVLYGLDGGGKVVYTHRVQLEDTDGWMTFPDWDDASWTHRPTGGIISGRSGKDITIANLTATTGSTMDALYQSISIPLGLELDTEAHFSTISGDNNTALAYLQATSDASNPASWTIGHGLEQITAGTQRGVRNKYSASSYVGAADATVRRCRSAWALDSDARSPASIYQALTEAGVYFSVVTFIHGGLGFNAPRDFGLWVGRRTADGNPYTFEVKCYMRVS